MPGDFDARMAELAEMVGDGHLVAKVEVDQVYAKVQHEALDFNHPRGGQAKYLEQPWEGHATDFARRFAKALLEPGGLQEEARAIAEDGVTMVHDHAPVEFDNLRRSGHPTVTDNGDVVYDRPPEVHRLSKTELAALSESLEVGPG
jgi:hypothetical protein